MRSASSAAAAVSAGRAEGGTVPFVNVKAVRGVMTEAERARLIERITDVVVEVFARGREEVRPHIWVVVEEVEPGQWGSGGTAVDVDAVRRLTGRE
jgi:4-oxalocrotonate tautomerase